VLADLVDGHDVRVGDAPERLSFPQEPVAGERLAAQQLERNTPVQRLVVARVHDAHRPGADALQHPEAPDGSGIGRFDRAWLQRASVLPQRIDQQGGVHRKVVWRGPVVGEERLHLIPQRWRVGAGAGELGGSAGGVQVDDRVEELFYAPRIDRRHLRHPRSRGAHASTRGRSATPARSCGWRPP